GRACTRCVGSRISDRTTDVEPPDEWERRRRSPDRAHRRGRSFARRTGTPDRRRGTGRDLEPTEPPAPHRGELADQQLRPRARAPGSPSAHETALPGRLSASRPTVLAAKRLVEGAAAVL